MATLTVIYPRAEGTTFDYDYYQNKHLPLAGRRWADKGLTGGEALVGKAAIDGTEAPFMAIGIIHFDSTESLKAALNGEHAAEIIADIANFTNAEPIIQVSERIMPGA
jgi:uncharacterized protein (TIGR02118 family)